MPKLLLNIGGPTAPARFSLTGWNTCPALLALKVLMNGAQKVKCRKSLGQVLQGGWPQKLVILQVAIAGHLKLLMLKDL